VIFLTVGSDTPFNRLVKAFDAWCRAHRDVEAFAQIGNVQANDYKPSALRWVELLPSSEFVRIHDSASIIVAHAGVGSIITALAAAKTSVSVPGRADLRETRSDHQFATAKRFQDRTGLFIAQGEEELGSAIGRAIAYTEEATVERLRPFAPDSFTTRLREFMLKSSAMIN